MLKKNSELIDAEEEEREVGEGGGGLVRVVEQTPAK